MWFGVITAFPEMFDAIKSSGITKRAIYNKLIDLEEIFLRDFAEDKHKTIDDKPFGGGPGMILKPEPLKKAIDFAKSKRPNAKVIYLSPQGKQLNQKLAKNLVAEGKKDNDSWILICGRYEGIDQRIIDTEVDLEISIGDYVLSGGELAAMVLIDTLTRLLPGALGSELSAVNDSFSNKDAGCVLLDYDQYTVPREFNGYSVPEVLVSGDHKKIHDWRKKNALNNTVNKRPDLIKNIDQDK